MPIPALMDCFSDILCFSQMFWSEGSNVMTTPETRHVRQTHDVEKGNPNFTSPSTDYLQKYILLYSFEWDVIVL